MKVLNKIILINLLFLLNQQDCYEESSSPTMQSVLNQWFSIDYDFDIMMSKNLIEDNDDFYKFNLSFTSDDHSKVNGLLAIPKNQKKPFQLALLMHAMGTDQNSWWNSNKLSGDKISKKLLAEGYAVMTLDARRHGERKKDNLSPRDLIEKSKSQQSRIYTDMIIGTVRDYRLALNWLKKDLQLELSSILVSGYSMGAQMSLLLASYESEINQVMVMVPPYVSRSDSPVAPRLHVSRIKNAELILLAAKNDPYSTQDNYYHVFNQISTQNKSIKWFDSGHLLPEKYYQTILNFLESLASNSIENTL